MKILGLSDEDRLAMEETTGIKTDAAKIIVDGAVRASKDFVSQAIKEIQTVIGPHGSVTRLQAGGVRISPSVGVSVFEDGVLKTTIEPDGDFLAGSDITQPSTTTFAVFVNEQTYNNETMGAGDLLIGNNSTGESNVKYDASEGQLQFRLGTTVNVYMDTDGTLKAGAGGVALTSLGIVFENVSGKIIFKDSAGSTSNGTEIAETVDNHFLISNKSAGNSIRFYIKTTDASVPSITWEEDPVVPNQAHFDVGSGTAGAKFSIGGDYILWAGSAGESVFNGYSENIDHRFKGVNDTELLFLDSSTDRVGIGIAAPAYKLDVDGDVNIPTGSKYKINATNIKTGVLIGFHAQSGTVTASTTSYLIPYIPGITTVGGFPMPAGVVRKLTFRQNSAQPASGSLVVTLQKNLADTAVTVTAAAGSAAQVLTDTSNTATFADGDVLNLKLVNNATAASAQITYASLIIELDAY